MKTASQITSECWSEGGWTSEDIEKGMEEYAKQECIAFLSTLQKEYDWDNLDIKDADPEELYQLYKDGEV